MGRHTLTECRGCGQWVDVPVHRDSAVICPLCGAIVLPTPRTPAKQPTPTAP